MIGENVVKDTSYRVYGYRWVVLGVFMLANLAVQMLWISYAAITDQAARYYGVTATQIGYLAIAFMAVYVFLSIPESWVIDRFGFHLAISVGVVLMGAFGLLRGLVGTNFGLVVLGTVGIAIGQPFLMNSWTKVPANWFSINERATAVGLVTLANLVGTAIGLFLTPILAEQLPIPTVQLIYGAVAAISAVLFIALSREHPVTPPCPPGMEVRSLMLDGLKQIVRTTPFWLFVIVYFFGMGMFNGIVTWINGIFLPRGFNAIDAGWIGGLMVMGGIIGAVILPSFSDKEHKRQRYLLLGVLMAIPGLVGIAFATSLWLLLISAFWFGFFLISLAPIGLQYVAEVTYPAPEGTSTGVVQWFGQVAFVFVIFMDGIKTKNGAYTPSLIISVILLLVMAGVITQMKDPQPRKI